MRKLTGVLSRCTFLADSVSFLTRTISVVGHSACYEAPATFRDVKGMPGAKRLLQCSLSTSLNGRGKPVGHDRHVRSVVASVLIRRFSSQTNGDPCFSW